MINFRSYLLLSAIIGIIFLGIYLIDLPKDEDEEAFLMNSCLFVNGLIFMAVIYKKVGTFMLLITPLVELLNYISILSWVALVFMGFTAPNSFEKTSVLLSFAVTFYVFFILFNYLIYKLIYQKSTLAE